MKHSLKNADMIDYFVIFVFGLIVFMLLLVGILAIDMAASPKELVGTRQGAITDKIDEMHYKPLRVGGTTIYRTTHNYYIIIDDVGKREITENEFMSINEGDMISYTVYHVKGKLTGMEEDYIELDPIK